MTAQIVPFIRGLISKLKGEITIDWTIFRYMLPPVRENKSFARM